ncbi:MAG TPA: channel protein TolC, partial [Burkholderiales bacterium]|nr:channel protein TolC [Burkholderiales bacterium]
MRLPRILTALVALAAQAPLQLPAHAQDLLQVYRDAKSYDAQYASARSALQAGLEKLPQGRALILPSVGLTANVTSTRIDTVPHNLSTAPAVLRDAHSLGYTVSFSQPLYRPQNLLQNGQAEYQ